MLCYNVNLRPDLVTLAEFKQLNGGLNKINSRLSVLSISHDISDKSDHSVNSSHLDINYTNVNKDNPTQSNKIERNVSFNLFEFFMCRCQSDDAYQTDNNDNDILGKKIIENKDFLSEQNQNMLDVS